MKYVNQCVEVRIPKNLMNPQRLSLGLHIILNRLIYHPHLKYFEEVFHEHKF